MKAGGDTRTDASARPLDALSIAALVYVLVPTVVFFAGWLKTPFAIVGMALLALHLRRSINWKGVAWDNRPPLPYVLLVLGVAVAWAMFGGAGHFAYANPDWLVRDAVYGDLIRSGWPVAYGSAGGVDLVLRSAIGFFLPPAALAKLVGPGWADPLLFGWTVIGAALFLLLLPLAWRARPLALGLLLVAVLFSGMDLLGIFLTTGEWPIFPLRLEWWVKLSYSSLTGQLYWAPNHALPLWLSAALFFRHWRHPDFLAYAIPFMLGTLIWTPFAVLGMAPFFLLFAIVRLSAGGLPRGLAGNIALAGLLAYPVVRLLTQDLGGVQPTPTAAMLPTAGAPAPAIGDFLLHTYAPFVLMEFAILALLLAGLLRHSRALLWTATGVLALLPFFSLGPSNDTLLRISTPSLVMLLALALPLLQERWSGWRDRRLLIVAVLAIGAATPFNEIWRGATWRRVPADYGHSLVERLKGNMPAHYVGRLTAPDLRWLMREPQRVPAGGAPLSR